MNLIHNEVCKNNLTSVMSLLQQTQPHINVDERYIDESHKVRAVSSTLLQAPLKVFGNALKVCAYLGEFASKTYEQKSGNYAVYCTAHKLSDLGGKKFHEWRENQNNWTPLHFAAIRGYVEMGNLLLDSGANINDRDDNGQTPLHLAINNGNFDFVSILLFRPSSNIDLAIKDMKGLFPIQTVAVYAKTYDEYGGNSVSDLQFVTNKAALKVCSLLHYRNAAGSESLANYLSDDDLNYVTKHKNFIAQKNADICRAELNPIEELVRSTITDNRQYNLQYHQALTATYQNLYAKELIQPILKLATMASLGYHDLASNTKSRQQKLLVRLDPDRDEVSHIAIGNKDCYGLYFRNDNTVYVAGKRITVDEVLGTLIHELTHFIVDEIYQNSCNPYKANDSAHKQEFTAICNELKSKYCRGESMPITLQEIFGYEESEYHGELIVRTAQILAENSTGYQILSQQAPSLLRYFEHVFLPDCKHHYKKLKEDVFLTSTHLAQTQPFFAVASEISKTTNSTPTASSNANNGSNLLAILSTAVANSEPILDTAVNISLMASTDNQHSLRRPSPVPDSNNETHIFISST